MAVARSPMLAEAKVSGDFSLVECVTLRIDDSLRAPGPIAPTNEFNGVAPPDAATSAAAKAVADLLRRPNSGMARQLASAVESVGTEESKLPSSGMGFAESLIGESDEGVP